ncbi:hypothetical protein ACFWPU_21445 [Streptomyces sp. NPDC058471]|uniref:hypothetical protein n=1 Tax=Streptomyces sp. NPDC058471 TaxID=3346516 RepID=UPI00364F8A8E
MATKPATRLIDHNYTGLLGWLSGGFAVLLVAYVVALAAGVTLTVWSPSRAKALGRRS